MAEFGEDDRLPPVNHSGDSAEPSDEAADKTRGEAVSVLNGDCGTPEDIMVGSGSLGTPGSRAGVENASVGPDAKSEIPRRSSIIKVSTGVHAFFCAFSAKTAHLKAGQFNWGPAGHIRSAGGPVMG